MLLDPVVLGFTFISILIAFVIHEFAHGWAAYQLGDPTAKYEGRLTFNPIVHLDWFGAGAILLSMIVSKGSLVLGWGKPVQFNSENFRKEFRDAALVAAAGPAANFILAGLLFPVLAFGMNTLPPIALKLLYTLLAVNFGLALFNCLPCPPLDGWKILQFFVPRPTARSMQRIEVRYGWQCLVGLLLVTYFLDPIGIIFRLTLSPFWRMLFSS